jgi:hypothetical protein
MSINNSEAKELFFLRIWFQTAVGTFMTSSQNFNSGVKNRGWHSSKICSNTLQAEKHVQRKTTFRPRIKVLHHITKHVTVKPEAVSLLKLYRPSEIHQGTLGDEAGYRMTSCWIYTYMAFCPGPN